MSVPRSRAGAVVGDRPTVTTEDRAAVEGGTTVREVVGYLPGAFDMFHVGHLRIIRRAQEHCTRLVVGVVTDEVMVSSKGKAPVVPLDERVEVVQAVTGVHEVVPDTSADKTVAWRKQPYDVLFKGDDWRGTPKGDRLEADMAALGVRVVYFPYTTQTSSTLLRRSLTAAL
ncbi:glycerol-3-phosphate cytidylyltransferase [Pseudokineococcus lusitanus]|uniref:Glycerol-3-phosphate cytidylyltransferase n=1 Tax=Pseudokineococcus lusitanus TaxID=763993 RepID=A0A3N1HKE6_9ACTN|nr:adenylyltransferase/cytidyltransferase family protein [Pseudokineococcus lusitanus]ROP43008.1 glycerol-3-phosphate cytidylyltransferase [Pseudokineococcus lusitanus]